MATGKATPATTPRPAGEVKKSLVACMLEKTSGLMALLSATPPAAQSTLIAVVVQNSFDEFSVTRRGAAIIAFSLRESSFAGVKVEEATLAVVATDGAETGLLTGSGVGAADFEVLAGLCCTLATACATGPAAFTTGGTGGAAGVAITEAVVMVAAFAAVSTGETAAGSAVLVFCSATSSSAAREICSSRSSTEKPSSKALKSISISRSSPKSISSACSSAFSTSRSSFCALDLEAIVRLPRTHYCDGRTMKEPLQNFLRHFASYRVVPVKEIGVFCRYLKL